MSAAMFSPHYASGILLYAHDEDDDARATPHDLRPAWARTLLNRPWKLRAACELAPKRMAPAVRAEPARHVYFD